MVDPSSADGFSVLWNATVVDGAVAKSDTTELEVEHWSPTKNGIAPRQTTDPISLSFASDVPYANALTTQLSYRRAGAKLLHTPLDGVSLISNLYEVAVLKREQLPSYDSISIATNLMNSVLRVAGDVYKNVLEKCHTILTESDIDDQDSRARTIARLTDVLEPFQIVLATILQGLIQRERSNPLIFAFLLGEVLVSLDGLEAEARIIVIKTFLNDPKASLRYSAAQALDSIGIEKSKKVLAEFFPRESNQVIKGLIEASLGGLA